MARNVLLTGASGRLGNFVAPYLKSKGYNVTCFDNAPQPPDSENVKLGLPFVQGNLLSLGDCMRAIAHAQADIIVHLGAIPFNTEIAPAYAKDYGVGTEGSRFVQRFDEDLTMNVNTMGTYYILDAARRLGVKDIVAAGSYFALGIGFRISGTSFPVDYLPIDEEHPCVPEDSYSLSKYLNEETLKAFSRAYGMNCVALRLMGIYYYNNEMSNKNYSFGINVPDPEPGKVDYMTGSTFQYVDARDAAIFIELSIKAIEGGKMNPFEAFFTVTDTTYVDNTVDVVKKCWPSLADKAAGIKGSDGLISYEKARKLLGYEPQNSWRKK